MQETSLQKLWILISSSIWMATCYLAQQYIQEINPVHYDVAEGYIFEDSRYSILCCATGEGNGRYCLR